MRPHQHTDSHSHTNTHISYRCGKSRGQRHLQVAFEPQQCWNQDEHLRHLCKHRPVLQRSPCNISNTTSTSWTHCHIEKGHVRFTETRYTVTCLDRMSLWPCSLVLIQWWNQTCTMDQIVWLPSSLSPCDSPLSPLPTNLHLLQMNHVCDSYARVCSAMHPDPRRWPVMKFYSWCY